MSKNSSYGKSQYLEMLKREYPGFDEFIPRLTEKEQIVIRHAGDLAKSLNQAIVVRIIGPMYGVYYPYRKTSDLYVAIEGHPIRCCQCDEDVPVDDGLRAWRQHIRDHSRRKLVNPIIFVARDNEGELHVAEEKREVGK